MPAFESPPARRMRPAGLGMLAGALLAIGIALPAQALTLEQAFALARAQDPQYKVAEAERTLNQDQSRIARSAFLPGLSYSYTQRSTDSTTTSNNSNGTVTIAQPLFSAEKIAQFQQADPLSAYADATFATREQDLAVRLFTAVSKLILANEALAANEVRIQNLQRQADRARRMFELGQASITDKRDVQVKVEQARANKLTLQIQKSLAEMQIGTLTGTRPAEGDFGLPNEHSLEDFASQQDITDRVLSSNPKLIAARNTETISRLDAQRLRGQLLPTVALSHTAPIGGGATSGSAVTGLTVNVPLDAQKVISSLATAANIARAAETRRDAEEQTLLQASQLYETVNTGREAMRIKRSAIEAAELSVEANTRSAQAGVRSTMDVLNSIDLLYQTRNEYATTTVSVGEALLNLLLISAHAPADAIAQTQDFLFKK